MSPLQDAVCHHISQILVMTLTFSALHKAQDQEDPQPSVDLSHTDMLVQQALRVSAEVKSLRRHDYQYGPVHNPFNPLLSSRATNQEGFRGYECFRGYEVWLWNFSKNFLIHMWTVTLTLRQIFIHTITNFGLKEVSYLLT